MPGKSCLKGNPVAPFRLNHVMTLGITGIHRIGCQCSYATYIRIPQLLMSRHSCTQHIQMPLIQTITLEVMTLKVIFLPSLGDFRMPDEPSTWPPELSDQFESINPPRNMLAPGSLGSSLRNRPKFNLNHLSAQFLSCQYVWTSKSRHWWEQY